MTPSVAFSLRVVFSLSVTLVLLYCLNMMIIYTLRARTAVRYYIDAVTCYEPARVNRVRDIFVTVCFAVAVVCHRPYILAIATMPRRRCFATKICYALPYRHVCYYVCPIPLTPFARLITMRSAPSRCAAALRRLAASAR